MTFDEALEWIHSRLKFNIRPGLIRVERLLELLGNPERELSMLHVAGTNGKGSTVAFLRSIFMEKDLKVASFTSPYIEQFGERMAINGQPIPDGKLVFYVEKIKPLVENMDTDECVTGITEFEIITALSLLYFKDEQVDLAIIEVGLGGLLDSTNVITPKTSVITTIGLDHMDILGKTLPEIAAQKAGIIKRNIPVIVGNISNEALDVITRKASEMNAPTYLYQRDFHLTAYDDERFDFENSAVKFDKLEKKLIGRHQIENAGLAVQAALVYAKAEQLELTENDIRNGLKKTFWPARMEEILPKVFLDGAHNTHAMERLTENLQTHFKNKKIHIIFSAITTKDISEMLQMLQKIENTELTLTTFDYPKALNLADFLAQNTAENWQEKYVELSANLTENDVILFTGSLYFMSQVREYLLEEQK